MDKVKVVKPREVFERMLESLEMSGADAREQYKSNWRKLRAWMANPDGTTRGFLVHPFELEFLLDIIEDKLKKENAS